MGATAKRLGGAHRGVDSELPRRVVRGRHDTTPVGVPADDERLVPKGRILELFDGGEERVEVEMGKDLHPGKATVGT